MRNALAYVPNGQHTMVAAAIREAFIQPDHDNARADLAARRRPTARQMAEKLGGLMDDAEGDVLA